MLLPSALAFALSTIVVAPAGDTSIVRERLAEGIYLFRVPYEVEQWTATNTVVVVNDDDVTVFDSNTRPSTARRIIAEIRALTAKPVRTLVNSHWHMDHWSGNSEYVRAFPGVQIVATTETRDYMKRMGNPFYLVGITRGLQNAKAQLDSAVRSGKQADGSPLTAAARRDAEQDIALTEDFAREVGATSRVLPTLAYRDTLVLWSGGREFRFFSVTGDATASTVMYLPRERILVTGDVLVTQEKAPGPPPWTTNSFAITPWYHGLRRLQALDVSIIVPGQGPAFHDKAYLTLTADLFESLLAQVHAALERGLVTTDAVMATIDIDAFGARFTPGAMGTTPALRDLARALVRKIVQESFDGVSR